MSFNKRIFKQILFLGILALFIPVSFALSECDDDGFVYGTKCPCSNDPAVASICGQVLSSGLRRVPKTIDGELKDKITTRTAVGGATVTLYSNLYTDKRSGKEYSTGKPYGRLENKIGECYTTPFTGRFWCKTNRILDGNVVYAIPSCNGNIGRVYEIPTMASITDLKMEIDCFGHDNTPTSMPDKLDLVDESFVLACTTSTEDIRVGYEDQPTTYMTTDIGEDNFDFRIIPYSINLGSFGIGAAHNGALYWQDCLIEYLEDPKRNYLADLDIYPFDDVLHKCNPDLNGDGEGDFLDYEEAIIEPFLYNLTNQCTEEAYRVFSNRDSLHTKNQDAFANQQYVEATLGDCIGDLFLRPQGSTDEATAPACSRVLKCTHNFDRLVNFATVTGISDRTSSPIHKLALGLSQEADPEMLVCLEPDGTETLLKHFRPKATDDDCEPGSAGCQYRYENLGLLPFMVASFNTQEQFFSEIVNDSFNSENIVGWEGRKRSENEAQGGSANGTFSHVDASNVGETNSGGMAARVANPNVGTDDQVLGASMVGPLDAMTQDYTTTGYRTLTDYGSRIYSHCGYSGSNGQIRDIEIGQDGEDQVITHNNFIGNNERHQMDDDGKHGGSSAIYGTPRAMDRDRILAQGAFPGSDVQMFRYVVDLFDLYATAHASGDGELKLDIISLLLGGFKRIKDYSNDNNVKIFGQRKSVAEEGIQPVHLDVDYVTCNENFPGAFPAYPNQAASGNGSFEWEPVEGNSPNNRCNRWPGPKSYWDNNVGDMAKVKAALGINNWPGVEGEMRSCKVVDCEIKVKRRRCELYDPITNDCDITPGNIYYTVSTEDCSEQDKLDYCYPEQLEKWPAPTPSNNDVKDYPRRNATSETIDGIGCKFERLGKNQTPGSVLSSAQFRIQQKPFSTAGVVNAGVGETVAGASTIASVIKESNDEYLAYKADTNSSFNQKLASSNVLAAEAAERSRSLGSTSLNVLGAATTLQQADQVNIKPVSDILNYTANAFRPPLQTITSHKGAFLGAGHGNYKNGLEGNVHEKLSGAQAKGDGTGAVPFLIDAVELPEAPSIIVEELPEPAYFCAEDDPGNPNCEKITPPGPINLEELDPGDCKPVTIDNDLSSCPYKTNDLMATILGAAGNNNGFNVPGSVILAFMYGEGTLGAHRWTTANTYLWSEPYYNHLPGCQGSVSGAQPPVGMGILGVSFTTPPFGSQSVGLALNAGGFHPDRVNPDGIKIVNKCNFLDGAYMLAALLGSEVNASSCTWTADMVKTAIENQRGGVPMKAGQLEIAMECM